MIESRAAHRYALALIEIAEEQKKVSEVSNDLVFIEKLLDGSPDLVLFFKSPVVNTLKKKNAFTELFGKRVSELTMKFILLLTSKDREALLPDIIRQFYRLRDERMGILNVVARTVIDLTKEQEEHLVGRIQDLTKKKVHLTHERDASLIGGFTVQYDDTVLDASVKHQFEVLRERFAAN